MLAHAHANICIYIYRCSGRRQPGPSTACVQTARACGGVGVYTFYYTCMAAGLPVLAHAHRQARTHGHTHTHIHIYFLYVYLHAYMYICICVSTFTFLQLCDGVLCVTNLQADAHLHAHARAQTYLWVGALWGRVGARWPSIYIHIYNIT